MSDKAKRARELVQELEFRIDEYALRRSESEDAQRRTQAARLEMMKAIQAVHAAMREDTHGQG